MTQPGSLTPKINKDVFWALIDQAKEHRGGPNEWLMEQLMERGAAQTLTFDIMARVYVDLAYQYGLWTAASVMERNGCSDDGFIDFRLWLIGQGKDVYMAALKDPDSLADAPSYRDGQYASLANMGDYAYEELTGRPSCQDFDSSQYRTLTAELKKGIVYGDGIGYPYDWADAPAYLPRLCAKYLTAERLKRNMTSQQYAWNLKDPDIQTARRMPKSKNVKNRGAR